MTIPEFNVYKHVRDLDSAAEILGYDCDAKHRERIAQDAYELGLATMNAAAADICGQEALAHTGRDAESKHQRAMCLGIIADIKSLMPGGNAAGREG